MLAVKGWMKRGAWRPNGEDGRCGRTLEEKKSIRIEQESGKSSVGMSELEEKELLQLLQFYSTVQTLRELWTVFALRH